MERFMDSVKDSAYGKTPEYFGTDNVLYFFGNDKRSVEIHSTEYNSFEVNYFDVDGDGNGNNVKSETWPFNVAPEPMLAYAYLRQAWSAFPFN